MTTCSVGISTISKQTWLAFLPIVLSAFILKMATEQEYALLTLMLCACLILVANYMLDTSSNHQSLRDHSRQV